jgi:hypothetical protein
MLKKFLAGLTALALSLGMVVLTAGPASAHHSTITATVACTSPTAATITWSVQNWNGGKTGEVVSSTNNLVPAGTQFASNETKQYTQNVTSTGTYTLSVTMKWWDGDSWENQTTNSGSKQVKSSDLDDCEPPDDTDDKIEICHATASDSNPYTTPEVSKSSIITLDPNGHGTHGDDIIPPFTYIKQGVPGSYPGQNWDAYGQAVYADDCDYPDVKPASPTFTNAQCTGPGTYGQASYTIPGTANVTYTVSIDDGSWTVKAAGTYFVNVGTKVEVHAEAADGYEIDGTDDWSTTFSAPDCAVDVTPTKPSIVQAVCTGEGQVGDGTFTIPAITGIQYKIWDGDSWQNISAGVHSAHDGDTVLIRAYPLSGYGLTDHDHNKEYKSYELEFDDINSSTCDVPAAPTFTAQVCTGPGTSSTASYTIPSDTGITYQVRIDGGAWQNVSAGTVDVVTFPRLIEVQALADGDIIVPGSTTSWSHNFTSAGDCLVNVYPVAPDWTDSICQSTTTGSTQATFEVFATANVTYQVSTSGVDYAPILAGVHNATVGTTVWIKAVPASGYQLAGDTGPWSHAFTDPGECLDPAYPAAAAFTDSVCEPDTTGATQGTYEVFAATHVTYEVSTDGGTTWAPVSVGVHNADPLDSVSIRALADSGYELKNDTGPWSHTFADPGTCLDEAFPGDPKFVESSCEANTTGSTPATYEIVAAAHVSYEISFDNVTFTTVGASVGIHTATPGSEIWIKAIADPGYEILGTTVWYHEFADPGDCLDEATATPATDVDQKCVVDENGGGSFVSGYLVIPNSANVEYFIDGSVTPATPGQVTKVPGTYTVTAAAMPGYELVGDTGPWVLEIKAADLCGDLITKGDVTPIVSFKQTTCSASGSYTLAVMVDDDPTGVIWTVSGGLPNSIGTHSVTTAGTVNITAAAATGFGLSGDADGIIQWSFEFTTLTDECLPTLALTGGSIAAGGLGLSALLTLGGILVFNARKRDRLVTAE